MKYRKFMVGKNAVNSFRVDFDCDIYITGSNAYLLSSELSTYLPKAIRGNQGTSIILQRISGIPRLYSD